MEANELRIGNHAIATDCGGGEFQTVVNGLVKLGDNNVVASDAQAFICTGFIPLTEEWLVKFGFKIKDGRAMIGELEAPFYDYKLDLFTNSDVNNIYCYKDFRKQIKYVHQLQNLYFALTGEELTIA